METRAIKRRRILELETKIDHISNLPDTILHQILLHLPIKTVAKTSVISKRWRSIWITLPDLDFTTFDPSFNSSTNYFNTPILTASQSGIISHVLSHRDKNTDIRLLRFSADISFSLLSSTICKAIRQNVSHLEIKVGTKDYCNFPRYIIGSESLRVLKLKSCYRGFRLPPSSIIKSRFESLHTLSLSLVTLHDQPFLSDFFSHTSFPSLKKLRLCTCVGLKSLHVGCRALEYLCLNKCFHMQSLEVSCEKLTRIKVVNCFSLYSENSSLRIHAPKLQNVTWHDNTVTDVTIMEHLRYLREASIGFSILREQFSTEKLASVHNFLAALSQAHSLTFDSSSSIKILSNMKFLDMRLHPFCKLQSLTLHAVHHGKSNVHGMACVFRSCSTLHTLILRFINDFKSQKKIRNTDLWLWDDENSTEEEQLWESQIEIMEGFLQHLKVVNISGFIEFLDEVILVKFLLKHGKTLEEMIVCSGYCESVHSLRRQEIRSKLKRFSRASYIAKLAFH